MSARDELATAIRFGLHEYGAIGTVSPEIPLGVPVWGDRLWSEDSDCPEGIAAAIWDAGWRKMPSRSEVMEILAQKHPWAFFDGRPYSETSDVVDAILALMDDKITETPA